MFAAVMAVFMAATMAGGPVQPGDYPESQVDTSPSNGISINGHVLQSCDYPAETDTELCFTYRVIDKGDFETPATFVYTVQKRDPEYKAPVDKNSYEYKACMTTYSLDQQDEATVMGSEIFDSYQEYLDWLANEQFQVKVGSENADELAGLLTDCISEIGTDAWYD